MSSSVDQIARPPQALEVSYSSASAERLLAQPDVLAVLGFGDGARLPDDPRALRVGLEPLHGPVFEVWRAAGVIRSGRDGDLNWSRSDEYLAFSIEVEEDRFGGIAAATHHAYECVTGFLSAGAPAHLLRLWNYLDAINLGAGDDERYRQFCAGRAQGMRDFHDSRYPAATAIGRHDGVRTLQVYGLAARTMGRPLENPRQVSAWRYPRHYGPTAPTFARGLLSAAGQLLISGTAAVVGHASLHEGDLDAQIDETWANLSSLCQHGCAGSSDFGAQTLLKAYVRRPADAARVEAAFNARAPALGGLLLLGGDICRRELLVEVDGVHSPSMPIAPAHTGSAPDAPATMA